MSNKGLTSGLASSKSRAKAHFPPNISTHSFDPTTRDYFNFSIGDIWINKGTISAPLQRVWILVNQAANIATWVLFVNGGGGPVVGLQPDVGAVVNPLLGIIQIHNTDTNIVTSNGAPPANRLNLNLANSIVIANNITATLGTITVTAPPATLAIDAYGSVAIEPPFDFTVISGTASFGNTQNNVVGPVVDFRKNRNNLTIVSGDNIGNLQFQGYDANTVPLTGGYTTGAAIISNTGGTIGGGGNQRVPADLEFFTHRDAVAAGPVQRMVVAPDGRVTVNIADNAPTLKSFGNIAIAAGIDEGGTGGNVTITGVSNTAANNVGVFTILSKTANPLNSSGFLKIYIGGTEFWIPLFTTPIP